MPFLNFGGNKNKHFNLSDMNFFMKNMKNRYSDPDPLWNRIRIHFFQMWIRGSGSTITERWIRGSGSGSTFPKCGSQDPDPDPRQNEMDPERWFFSTCSINAPYLSVIKSTVKEEFAKILWSGEPAAAHLTTVSMRCAIRNLHKTYGPISCMQQTGPLVQCVAKLSPFKYKIFQTLSKAQKLDLWLWK